MFTMVAVATPTQKSMRINRKSTWCIDRVRLLHTRVGPNNVGTVGKLEQFLKVLRQLYMC